MPSRSYQCHQGPGWPISLILLVVPIPLFAAENLWQSSVGQTWFHEVRSSPGEHLAGTAWEASLTPGNVYNISFSVRQLQGIAGVLVGDQPAIPIDASGNYSFDFVITDPGERRMMFEALSNDVAARVNGISVTEQTTTTAIGSSALPTGHYWSFDGERNLNTEMVVPLQNPGTTTSYRLRVAQGMHDALTTPGVRGFWFSVRWRTVEVGDGVYDWKLIDDNMKVARDYGLKLIVNVGDRSFDGSNVMPGYFPSKYVIAFSGGTGLTGYVAKRWDPWVYKRIIRLYKAIAKRYASDAGLGGIATSETALGQLSGGDYTLSAYRNALTQIVTQSQTFLKSGKLLFYLNFLPGGDRSDMNLDARVSLLEDVPHQALLVGAPDITPDFKGVVRSLSPYRIHTRKNLSTARQFCHLQHIDQGHRGTNFKNNQYRLEYQVEIARAREREADPAFAGEPAVFELDDVGFHPEEVLGDLWQPQELLDFGRRNFDCDFVLWHHRNTGEWEGSTWQDIQQVILQNQL